MLKQLKLGFLVSIVVLFSACSQKNVEVSEETKVKPKQKVEKKEEKVLQAQNETVQTNDSNKVEVIVPKKQETKAEKTAPKLNNIYFDFDKFTIKENMRAVLRNNSKKLKDSEYKGTITLEGHCDDRGSNEYNYALGLKRAQSVKNELIEYGINSNQIKIMSFGENQPLCTKANKNCWSKNRRVELITE